MNSYRRQSGGFTIAEVSIATAIFSIILLVALAGFFAIGRLFYKSVAITQTQETTQQIIQDISGNIQSATKISPLQTGNGYTYYCVGNVRYTYNLNQEVNLDNPSIHSAPNPDGIGGSFGILKDELKGSASCAMPCNDQVAGTCDPVKAKKFTNPVELLGQKMRLEKFTVGSTIAAPDIYNVSIIIAYGDDDLLDYTVASPPEEHYASAVCKSGAGGEFCSVSHADTAIFKGLKF